MYFKAFASTLFDRFILIMHRSARLQMVLHTFAQALPGLPPGKINLFKGGTRSSMRSMAASTRSISSSEIKQVATPGSEAK